MGSPYSKFLWGMTVDSDCDSFATSLGTATITSGSYTTILELLAKLEDKLQDIDATFAVSVSSLGIVSIECDTPWTWTTGSTDDDLSTLLGLDESSDAVSAKVLTASGQHTHGWYPGLLSRTRTVGHGAGAVADKRWKPNHEGSRLFAGSGKSSAAYPASPLYWRDLTIGPVEKTEIDDADIGVKAFFVDCIAATFRWYPDRTLGVVNTPGTQDTDYYLCSFAADPDWRPKGRHPDWFSVEITLNKEPASGGAPA